MKSDPKIQKYVNTHSKEIDNLNKTVENFELLISSRDIYFEKKIAIF